MNEPSTLSDILFIAIVVPVAAFYVAAMLKTSPADAPGSRPKGLGLIVRVLVFSLVVPGVLAGAGRLERYDPVPPPVMLLVLFVTLCTVGLALSDAGKRLASGLPLAVLVGYQVFRVPLEWLLHRLYLEGVIPVEMTYEGRNFDIVSGLSSAVLAIFLARSRVPIAVVAVWNTLGLALLINIVVVAVLSTPTPFQVFTEGPSNVLPSMLPYVWLPTLLVQAALLGHLLVYRALWHMRE
ncbi:MAG: hypothetical protein FJ207_01285 [Gemmatimonadetes bacterium]|nr:hypothetical protein [Gemmatimonadota bacterium]